ncbi:DUF6512 family protein [Halothermothrix orenii]|uniref:Uncharacterized protein n=1 Tax=Halothermothrix orenii (strain H 168 / OCM 544 / DSM 9562) TaxID=373903 RepID=B8D1G2_HALOH|nr:DUF6512 family protein [Halothermothrix orenii]ACL69039.1 hypothetical protein Hore_02780 [Halothermothrix orenii H 168]
MVKERNALFKWEVAGIFWIIVVGSLLHFVYDWTDHSILAGLFAPVNESVWEHLKMGYWSLFFFGVIEYIYFKKKNFSLNGFFLGKALGVAALEGTILVVFYTYTAILKSEILWLDIASYIIGAIICQIVSYKIINREVSKKADVIGFSAFILFGIILMIFTFYPPRLPIFRDGLTGRYGPTP